MKHRHHDMICAKAANMDLVVFVKNDEWDLTESCNDALMFFAGKDYFLCLPKHKEACLHWLNGGDVEFISDFSDGWTDYDPLSVWTAGSVFMQIDYKFRIKPRMEKLYIAVKTDKHERLGGCRNVRICSHAFVSKEDAESYLDLSDSQLVEIEIEI